MSISVPIGGADGPTSIFLAGKLDMGWLNVFGLVMVILMLIPNIIYAVKFRGEENRCKNQVMNIIEQTGRYASMFLMIFNIGIGSLGFASIRGFLIYQVGNSILMLAYWITWLLFFIKRSYGKTMALAIIPTAIFLLSGILLRYIPMSIAAVIFGIGHIYVTNENAKSLKQHINT